MPAQVLPVSPRCSFMFCANETLIHCLFYTGQGSVQMNEKWMDRERKSLRMTGGGPVSGTTTNTVEISERVWTRWPPPFLWNATLNLQILIYVSLEVHRLQQKHGKLHDIWPQTSQVRDFCRQSFFFPFCISHLNKLHILAVVQIYLCRQKAMIAINHLLPRADFETLRTPFSMAEAVTSWQMEFDITVLC